MAKLKIQKLNGSITVDSYTGPTLVSGNHLGGVGGYTSQTIATIQPTVKINSATATVGSIIAQKGAHKFQVSDENTVADESVTVGKTYRINSVGTTTNWTAMGAGVNANTNDVFTAMAVGAGDGTVQNVGECTLVNLVTPTAANTMSIVCTAANVSNANVANIGATGDNRTTAYLTWNAGDVVSGPQFKVGQTINLLNSTLTGNVTITAINNGGANLTITTDTNQAIAANTTGFTATFQASKISNKYVWDFLNGGTAESSTTGGFTGSNNPNRYRYWFAEATTTFVKVASA